MKLSIITINYNNAKGLEKTIHSVLRQTSKLNENYEYIVIDGASTDKSLEIIRNNNINYISEPDHGISDAFNKGINHAMGEYLIMLNSGDEFYSDNTVENFLTESNGNDLYYGSVINSKSNTLVGRQSQNTLPDSIPHQGAFVSRKYCEKFKYSTQFKIRMDYDFFSRLLKVKNIKIKKLPYIITKYEDGGVSMAIKNRSLFYAEAVKIDFRDKNPTLLANIARLIYHRLRNWIQ
ncbi:glycosyltransferase [Providencia rettgeri]|uniref:glycosyltransferase n=1 Tax=Providencia rettgeri TaxID=587 RepID=UPI001BAE1A75|nr:glycosyltransferase [Providencia rettgeri]MBS0860888.1 glycosyltransferase [Providencia rettgeri]MBS0874967.1 glycosyltransferase [Providencia rettgeri]MBS0921893.1 glycosyltransferase [Providencia rettgeri]